MGHKCKFYDYWMYPNAEFSGANIRYSVIKAVRIGYISNFLQRYGFSHPLK